MDRNPQRRALTTPLVAGLILTLLVATALRLWNLHLLPPGLYFDEAFNGMDANGILVDARIPAFFTGNGGREPLFVYLAALAIRVLGPTSLSLRLISAFAGIVTLALLFPVGRWILADSARRDQVQPHIIVAWAALIAVAGLAVSFWHVSLSRLAFRAVLLPGAGALAIGFFWRAWTRARRIDYAWAGAWLAVTMYTYLAARLLPLVIVLFVAIELVVDALRRGRDATPFWPRWRPRLSGLLILALVALLLVAPLLVTLLREPALLLTRLGDTSLFNAPRQGASFLNALGDNVSAFARSLYVHGDDNLRHNLPGRPVNDWLQALLLSAGLLTALLHVRRPYARLLLIWLGIMALPAILSTEPVHSLRAAGVLPPLALLYGLGALGFAGLLTSATKPAERQTKRISIALAIIWAVLLISSGWQTATDYFQRWAHDPALGGYFQINQQLAASKVKGLLEAPDAPPLLISRQLFLQAQMGYANGPVYLTNVLPSEATRAHSVPVIVEPDHDGAEPMFILWREDGILRAVQVEAPVDGTGMSALRVDDQAPEGWPFGVPEWPMIQTGSLAQGTVLEVRRPRYPLDVRFANGVQLAGYAVEPVAAGHQTANSGFALHLFFDFTSEGVTPAGAPRAQFNEFDVFAHLRQGDGVVQTANGPIIGEHLPKWLLPDSHAVGPLLFEDIRHFDVPNDIPAGKSFFETGLYTYMPAQTDTTFERIAVLDGNGQSAADAVTLGGVYIGMPPLAEAAVLPSLDVVFGGTLELTSMCRLTDDAGTAQEQLQLAWRALDRPSHDYTAFVHLVDANGEIVAQHDAPLGAPGNGSHLWAPGETARADFLLALPSGLPREGRLRVGLYELVSGERLPIERAGHGKRRRGRHVCRATYGNACLSLKWPAEASTKSTRKMWRR